jgi:uncharacterized membrane protein YoaT (DUF817 family)
MGVQFIEWFWWSSIGPLLLGFFVLLMTGWSFPLAAFISRVSGVPLAGYLAYVCFGSPIGRRSLRRDSSRDLAVFRAFRRVRERMHSRVY